MNDEPMEYIKTTDPTQQALLYRVKGDDYFQLEEYTMSRDAYAKACEFYGQANDDDQQGCMIKNIGDTYYYTTNYSKAIEMYNNALTLFEKKRNLLGMFEVNLKMSKIFTYTGNFSRGKEMHEKASQFLQELEKSDDWRSNPLIKMRDNPDQYIDYLTQSGDFDGLGNEYLFKGQEYFGLFNDTPPPDYKKAFEMFTKAQECFEKIQNLNGLSDVHMYKGNIYKETKQYQNALEHYNHALQLAIQTGSILNQISLSQDKAYLYEETGDHEKALQQYNATLSLQYTVGDIQAVADSLFNKGLLLKK